MSLAKVVKIKSSILLMLMIPSLALAEESNINELIITDSIKIKIEVVPYFEEGEELSTGKLMIRLIKF